MFKSIQKYKYCSEKTWPYIPENFSIKPSQKAYDEASKKIPFKKNFITGALKDNIDGVKNALSKNYPVVFAFNVYDSFYKLENGLVPIPDKKTESLLGSHACCLLGFSDDKKIFIVQNSWGNNFGDNGYIYFPFDFMLDEDLAFEFYSINCYS